MSPGLAAAGYLANRHQVWRIVGAALRGFVGGMTKLLGVDAFTVLLGHTPAGIMGGSLQLLAWSFAASRLQLDALGRFFGELHFGEMTQVVPGGIKGLTFSGCVVAAIVVVRQARV